MKQIKKEKLHESYLHEFAKIECAVQYSLGKLSNLIVNVPQYFEDKESYYIVMEYSKYHGYFENGFGEQWAFVYDCETKTAELCGGDAGWQNMFAVIDGQAQGVILGRDELRWLQACWAAATGKR